MEPITKQILTTSDFRSNEIKTLKYNIENKINFYVNPNNSDLHIEMERGELVIQSQIATELLQTLLYKQQEIKERKVKGWLKMFL